ncbi:high mobility group-T protein [Chloropicon roscoffensis]|uniref:High mobility group-T protein n=1 Tax=Chloropicon roscoffensis TaxID=1461544 RepID=A0AAX4PK67_9CHLO
MAEHFPMGAYSAFPPYGFNMPMQTANGMYQMPPQTTMPMGSMTMPTPPGFGQPPQMQVVPKPKKKAKATPKKAAKKKPAKKKKPPKKKPVKKVPKPKLTKSGKKKKERDPLAPKRARTAFNFFLDAFREEYKITHPDVKGVVHCTKAGSEKWKTLVPAERTPYEEKAAAAREAYLKAKEEYINSGGPQKFKLAKGPPRPPTAYFVFLANFRKDRAASGAAPTSIKDVSKLAGQKWRELDPQDKVPYEQKAALAKAEYLKLKELSAEERVAAVGVKNPYAQFL